MTDEKNHNPQLLADAGGVAGTLQNRDEAPSPDVSNASGYSALKPNEKLRG